MHKVFIDMCGEKKERKMFAFGCFCLGKRGMMGFDIVSFGFISYHVYSLGLELLFILSILLLYTTVLCFSLYPYFIINVHKPTWDCAAYINIEGSL